MMHLLQDAMPENCNGEPLTEANTTVQLHDLTCPACRIEVAETADLEPDEWESMRASWARLDAISAEG